MSGGVIHHLKHVWRNTADCPADTSVAALASAVRARSVWMASSQTVASPQPQASLDKPSITTLEGIPLEASEVILNDIHPVRQGFL
jgi:hypothetical protein